MHVAILCEYGTVNGGENSILAMVNRLTGVDFTFFAPETGRLSEQLARAEISRVALSGTDFEGARLSREQRIAQLQENVAHLKPDVLHANSLAMGRLTGAAHELLGIPTTSHLRDILRLNRSSVADLNRNDALFAVSRETRAVHIEQGLDPDRVRVLYNGIDVDSFRPGSRSGYLHEELGLPRGVPLAAMIGQISLRKGQDDLIAAAVTVSRTYPDLHWLIVGERYSQKAESIAFERDLRQQVDAADLGDRVHWLGYRDDIRRLLPEVDVLVHPARQEPLGRVLLEAGACGVPIVATNVGGTPEIIEDGRTGLLVPPNDPDAIANTVETLLGAPALRGSLGKAARASVRRQFDLPCLADELKAHWQQVIANSPN